MSNKPENLRELPAKERLRLAELIYIKYPRLQELLQKMDYCRTHSKIAAEPEGMLITGMQGAGKTTLRKAYARGFPRVQTGTGTVVPVLSAGILPPAAPKSLVSRLLAELEDPGADKGTIAAQTMRLYRYLKKCRVELIILDEFQHFIDRDSLKVLRTISDWLKMLMEETRLPVVLIGMPSAVKVLDARENEQLKRRFPVRETLDAFGWSVPGQRKDFRCFLKLLDEELPFTESSHLSDTEMALRIHCATGGVINYVMMLARRATALALEQKRERLEMDLLAQAYEERLAQNNLELPNPFTSGAVLQPVVKAPAPGSGATGEATSKRVRARKREQPLSTILSQH